MDVYVNVRKVGKHVTLAVCDVGVLGKRLKHGNTVFHISEKFYKGSLVYLDEALDLIQQSSIVNMVGCNIVKKAVEKGLVHSEAVIDIEGVPHAQIVKL